MRHTYTLGEGCIHWLKGKPGCFGSGVQSKQLLMFPSTFPEQGTVDPQGMGPWENVTDMVSGKQAS